MNLKFCFFAFCISFISLVKAQNLVPNNSFEEIEKCLVYEIPYKFHMKNWWTPNKGTPDIFSANCITKFNMPKNYGGKSYPAHGEAYVGIVVYSAEKNQNPKDSTDFNYAEYLQTKLKQKLVKDSVYRVSFFYQLGTNSRYSSSGLGVHFSRKKIKSNTNFLSFWVSIFFKKTKTASVFFSVLFSLFSYGNNVSNSSSENSSSSLK